ncbi:MAG: hypothetical protein ACLFO1_06760 [Spirochaetaceae bacterium]
MGMNVRMRRALVLNILLILVAGSAIAAVPVESVEELRLPENFEARRALKELIVAPRREAMRSPERVIRQVVGAEAVRYEMRTQNGHFYLLFTNREDDEFAVYNRGSYIIKRRLDDGAFVQVKVFYRSDPGFFVRMFPEGNRTVMDLYVGGVRTYRDVVIPASFGSILIEPFAAVQRMTRDIIRWEELQRVESLRAYESVARMVETARRELPHLPDAEDGAMSADGSLVFIESLVLQDQLPGFNCSGFAKWICDGIAHPATGSFLEIEPLKEKHLDLRGHQWSRLQEEERDPYFGLDWSRNLARHIAAIEPDGSSGELPHPEALDVRSVPFSSYVEDVGFPVSELPRIMYFLALREPGHFYIASLSRDFGEDPPLRQHVHVAVLFPYFDADGSFRTAVMERNVETSLESLERRYGEDYIHLVRIRARRDFVPPRIRTTD